MIQGPRQATLWIPEPSGGRSGREMQFLRPGTTPGDIMDPRAVRWEIGAGDAVSTRIRMQLSHLEKYVGTTFHHFTHQRLHRIIEEPLMEAHS